MVGMLLTTTQVSHGRVSENHGWVMMAAYASKLSSLLHAPELGLPTSPQVTHLITPLIPNNTPPNNTPNNTRNNAPNPILGIDLDLNPRHPSRRSGLSNLEKTIPRRSPARFPCNLATPCLCSCVGDGFGLRHVKEHNHPEATVCDLRGTG